jgi:hypothetical protein
MASGDYLTQMYWSHLCIVSSAWPPYRYGRTPSIGITGTISIWSPSVKPDIRPPIKFIHFARGAPHEHMQTGNCVTKNISVSANFIILVYFWCITGKRVFRIKRSRCSFFRLKRTTTTTTILRKRTRFPKVTKLDTRYAFSIVVNQKIACMQIQVMRCATCKMDQGFISIWTRKIKK